MTEVARKLSNLSYTLYSGGADGADNAFEIGSPNKRIFLPWDGFNNRKADGDQYVVPPYREDLVKLYHPAGDRLKPGALKLMSRNSYQVLGPDLKSPVDFVVCWTKDGKASGGTGQAIRIAESLNIPVFNLKRPNDLNLLGQYITTSNAWR
jgi:hypothetical protein